MKETQEKKARGFSIKTAIENLLFILFSLMVVIVFINVVARFVFNNAITSSEEIARFCLIWLVFIGAALALAENEHLGFDLLVNVLPGTAKKNRKNRRGPPHDRRNRIAGRVRREIVDVEYRLDIARDRNPVRAGRLHPPHIGVVHVFLSSSAGCSSC